MPCFDGEFIVDDKKYGEVAHAIYEEIIEDTSTDTCRGVCSLFDMIDWANKNNVPYSTNSTQDRCMFGKTTNKITIGCYDYTINLTKEPIIVNNSKCHGKIDYHAHEISIADDDCYSEQSKEQTLWHEIVHGIIRYRNIDYGKVDEETFVDELATGLYLLCKSNGLLPGQNITKDK